MTEHIYVVTDIEIDGFWPGPNSMRSFASATVSSDKVGLSTFEAVLEPLPGAAPNPDTLAWFATQPGAWEAATTDPQPVTDVMSSWVDWIKGLDAPAVFVASPLAFDGGWLDYYLRRYTSHGLVQGPDEVDVLFDDALCLRSFAAGVTRALPTGFSVHNLPKDWFGDVPHTHRAIDDALGYANLLATLLRRLQPTKP